MDVLIKASCPIKIHLYDVDPMNVVWHGNYLRFFEKARSALLELLDYDYQQMKASGYVWPIVDFRIKYIKPLRLQQTVIVEAGLIEYENRLKIDYRIYDEKTGELLTKANSIQLAVNESSQTTEFESPQILKERVRSIIA